MKIRVIVNPRAGGENARRRVPYVESILRASCVDFEIVETRRPDHAAELVRQARAAGVSLLAAMGGDGTISEICQAYLDPDGKPIAGPELGLIPCGTGGDFRKTFGLTDDLKQSVERMLATPARSLDLGLAELAAEQGGTVRRAFANIGSFGISGVVTRLVNNSPKWWGGKATFYSAALRATLGYRNAQLELFVNGQRVHAGPTYGVAIANGQYFGGGMRIAPAADPRDGHFQCVTMGDLSKTQAIGLSGSIYKGTHLRNPKINSFSGQVFEARPLLGIDPVPVELDGETPGNLPMTVTVIPAALQLRA